MFDKIQHPFMIKTLSKIEGNFLSLIKGTHEKPTANIILNDKRLKTFPLRSATRQRYLVSSLLSVLSWRF